MACRSSHCSATYRTGSGMKQKHKRLAMIVGSLAVMGLATTIILSSLKDTMIFFYTPTQLHDKLREEGFDASKPMRIGGLVKKGSVSNLKEGGISFIVTDLKQEMPVAYYGLVPSLFHDGQGVVAQGHLLGATLEADTILAKHDATYMPRQVVDALKASGRWEGGDDYKKMREQLEKPNKKALSKKPEKPIRKPAKLKAEPLPDPNA